MMKSQPKWLQVLGQTRDGVFVVDARQRIVFWNKEAERLFGYSESEVMNQYCYRIIAGRKSHKTWCHANCQVQRQLQRGALPHDYDLLTRTKGGKDIWVNVSTIAAPTKARLLTVHLLRDVSARRQKEEEANKILASLRVAPVAAPNKKEIQGTVRSPIIASGLLWTLTRREIEVLTLLSEGHSNQTVARRLGISTHTARYHVKNALRKLGLHSRAEAVSFAFRNGLL